VSSFHGLVEVLQPIAVPVDVEDMGLVEEPVKDCRRGHLVAGNLGYQFLTSGCGESHYFHFQRGFRQSLLGLIFS
jgi:hypothetical protein